MIVVNRKIKTAYFSQRCQAKKRGIDWNFTFESWLDWWGDDILKRGRKQGQLVMARTGDTGAYHPDNVRKATVEENLSEGSKGRIMSVEHRQKLSESNRRRNCHWMIGNNFYTKRKEQNGSPNC